MKHPDRLGEFEQGVLLAVVHLEDDAYGVTIRREIDSPRPVPPKRRRVD